MKFWFFMNFQRVSYEKQAIEALSSDEAWFDLERWYLHEGMLAVTGVITAHDIRYPVRLVYPDQFPQVPAWVEPQEDVRWSTHQYGSGGLLCLELRPDNWEASATGADVLRSAYHLLEIENPLGEGNSKIRAPSADHVTEVQAYDWGANPVLIGADCQKRLKAGESQELKALRWWLMDNVWPIMVHDRHDRLSPRHPPNADFINWRAETLPVYLSLNSAPTEADDRGSLIEAAEFEPHTVELLKKGSAVVIFSGDSKLIAYHLFDENTSYRRKVFVLPEQNDLRSGWSPDAQSKQVAIIGVGSVGSKVAESLLRSGISHFTLIDGDVMLPVNLERHVLDWRDVGFRKVNGLKRRLLNIMPGADIAVVEQNLNWQRSARTHAQQVAWVADCDIIVNATGDEATALFLSAVAAANQRPFVSVEVYEGGIGALIASCLPERDPPFITARAAFLNWCKQQDVIPPKQGIRPYEAFADDGMPFVADDAAVTMAAAHTARIVLDILDGQAAGPEMAWMLIGFRKGWFFKGHGDTIFLDVRKAPDSSNQIEIQDVEAQAFISELVKEYLNASSVGT
ncbi:MAG: ThiF family adenylyltransferase [Chloroflexota bacterium]|nr:ThiF family adenylyltransferase [Chloroflexota bacterium]